MQGWLAELVGARERAETEGSGHGGRGHEPRRLAHFLLASLLSGSLPRAQGDVTAAGNGGKAQVARAATG